MRLTKGDYRVHCGSAFGFFGARQCQRIQADADHLPVVHGNQN